MNDESGHARHGTYSGPTLGQPGVGDGRTCPWFDGSNDSCDVFSADLASAFDWSEFSVALWVKLNSAAVWADGQNRRWVTMSGASEFLWLRKAFQENMATVWLRINGADYASTVNWSSVGGDWFHVGLTSKSGGNAYRYLNGSQATHKSGVAAASGNPMTSFTVSASAETHHGWLAHVAVWSVELSGAQMAVLAAPC